MQTRLHPDLAGRAALEEAERIIRTCVHCGFCNATCPTYQLLGDELDGPRGRIYLVRGLLADNEFSDRALLHLDRCLTCRGCETTCPSGVDYGRLLDAGRAFAEHHARRPVLDRVWRALIRAVVPWPRRFQLLLAAGRAVRWALPATLARQIPARSRASRSAPRSHSRQVLLLDGCVQGVATPATNDALARLLDRLQVEARRAPDAGCCGALDHHLSGEAAAREHMRRVVDRAWPSIESGVEAVLSSASGCGVHLKQYGELLCDDPAYAERAARFAALVKDPAEFLVSELTDVTATVDAPRVAWHAPCSLQHGQQITGVVEQLLTRFGVTLTETPEPHLCCGSAGSYSLVQPTLAHRLVTRKVANLESGAPDLIVTANVGCQLYLASATGIPVMHWVELLERLMATAKR